MAGTRLLSVGHTCLAVGPVTYSMRPVGYRATGLTNKLVGKGFTFQSRLRDGWVP